MMRRTSAVVLLLLCCGLTFGGRTWDGSSAHDINLGNLAGAKFEQVGTGFTVWCYIRYTSASASRTFTSKWSSAATKQQWLHRVSSGTPPRPPNLQPSGMPANSILDVGDWYIVGVRADGIASGTPCTGGSCRNTGSNPMPLSDGTCNGGDFDGNVCRDWVISWNFEAGSVGSAWANPYVVWNHTAGTQAADVANLTEDVRIGRAANGDPFHGEIAYCGYINFMLTNQQMRMLWFTPRKFAAQFRANVQYFLPITGHFSPEPDLSGNRANGTVSGTAAGANPPCSAL